MHGHPHTRFMYFFSRMKYNKHAHIVLSQITAASPRPLLSQAQTQTHINHIPQPLQTPEAALQLGTKMGYSLLRLPPITVPTFSPLFPALNSLKLNICFFQHCICDSYSDIFLINNINKVCCFPIPCYSQRCLLAFSLL